MPPVPLISGRECILALQMVGFYVSRQRGSHVIMRRDDPPGKTIVPEHKELARGTLRAIIRQARLSVEEFLDLL